MSNHNITWIDLYEDKGWDESQLVDITILQRTMGTISLVGSSYVIQEVLRNERKRNHTFHRLMVGLSTSDILSSFFVHILSTAPIPKGYHVFAVGNVATCDAQGFIMFLCFFTTTLYNCSLATYYLVQLKYNWAERRIKALEKRLHIVPWSVGLIFAIAGLVLKLYGSVSFGCAISPGYPFECIDSDSSIECIRGGSPSAFVFLHVALFSMLFLAMCYISVTMFMVYRSVSNIEIQGQRYSFAAYRSQANDRKRSRRVMLQGILYSLALFLTYIFSIVEIFNDDDSYVTHILEFTFWPLQGFFNALIYSIPVFQKMHKKWKEKRRERQTALLEPQEVATDESYKYLNIHSKLSKNGKNQEVDSFNFGRNKTSTLSNSYSSGNGRSTISRFSNNNSDGNRKSITFNDMDQSALMIDETIEEEGGNKDFDGEEVKEEIQKNNKIGIIHSGLIRDHQLQSKNNHIESNIVQKLEGSIGDHHGSDACDGEEMEEETQDGGNYLIPFPYHSGNVRLSYQSEESVENGVHSDADGSDSYNDDDDIDDYLALS